MPPSTANAMIPTRTGVKTAISTVTEPRRRHFRQEDCSLSMANFSSNSLVIMLILHGQSGGRGKRDAPQIDLGNPVVGDGDGDFVDSPFERWARAGEVRVRGHFSRIGPAD